MALFMSMRISMHIYAPLILDFLYSVHVIN